MSEPSKINANINAGIGAVKENIGYALGNKSMEADGAALRAKGNAEFEAAKAQGYAEGAADSMKGSVKDTVGSVLGNERMQAEGKVDKATGDVKKAANS